MKNEEANFKLAEWIGDDGFCSIGDPLDFFTDETASALLLEKLPLPTLSRHRVDRHNQPCDVFWCCHPVDGREANHPDRKTAIALAALRLIEKEKTHA